MPHFLIRIICYFALGGLIYVGLNRFSSDAVPIGMLIWGAAGGKYFAADLLAALPAIARAGRSSAHGKWEGRYYTYDGKQVRLCFVEDTVWIVEEDVRKIIKPAVNEREKRLLGTDHARIRGTPLYGYSEHGLVRLMKTRLQRRGGEAGMKKFMNWLQTEAIPNVRRFPASSMV